MPLTRDELEQFHRFAVAKLDNGGVRSLEDCLRQWCAAREEEELIADIREGLEDIKAGRVYTLEEVMTEIRNELNGPARDRSA